MSDSFDDDSSANRTVLGTDDTDNDPPKPVRYFRTGKKGLAVRESDSCELFYFCGGKSLLCRGVRPSCWGGCPPQEVLERIGELEEKSFREGGKWTVSQLREVLSEGASTASVVLVDDRIVAFALFRSVPPEGELLRLAVDPEQRKKGYARLLVHDGVEMLIERGIEEVYLEVAENNISAISLYASFGFKEAGRRNNYYPHLSKDGIVMKLCLADWPPVNRMGINPWKE